MYARRIHLKVDQSIGIIQAHAQRHVLESQTACDQHRHIVLLEGKHLLELVNSTRVQSHGILQNSADQITEPESNDTAASCIHSDHDAEQHLQPQFTPDQRRNSRLLIDDCVHHQYSSTTTEM
jgi:hypothetical protein